MNEEKITFYNCDECHRKWSTKEEALSCEKNDRKEKAFDNIKVFELKQIHLDLLKETSIDWDSCEFGAPCINCKRPYGDSDCENNIAEIIKLKKTGNWDKNEEMWNEKATDQIKDIHKETQIALQIVLHCQTFELGKYKLLESGWQKWEKM